MLNRHEIAAAVRDGRIGIDPYDPARLQPASYDVTLHSGFAQALGEDVLGIPYDPRRAYGAYRFDAAPDTPVELEPGAFLLASTAEHLNLADDIVARVEGKSSVGRMGLFVHVTAGFIDPGFTGQITLELYNARSETILLWPGMPIAQLAFTAITPVGASYAYSGKYQAQSGPTPSAYYRNWDELNGTWR